MTVPLVVLGGKGLVMIRFGAGFLRKIESASVTLRYEFFVTHQDLNFATWRRDDHILFTVSRRGKEDCIPCITIQLDDFSARIWYRMGTTALVVVTGGMGARRRLGGRSMGRAVRSR